ncbi:flagellar hook-associated protein FlgL [Desulfoscipio geothermicus]|uniref:Flagellar hook-associated protein 3 FlgL n=1 Tax=Desulfoscipio geothermicus DSM 3669 TaxID=1121426 RepID=A0A1I6CUK3_9FIRM|nr:flagellar hook-associated protein FlgL [Desulfoscipio geothermicus]SFQ96852.1 flagellar hook-associated protein 3 FlgL [Desulfoscipio geothermicus DSM 3669]
MRVTNGMIARHTRNYIQEGMQKLARTQEMMSTSKKIIRLSDDPTALSQLLDVKSSMEMNKQYMRNIQDGLSYLEGADTALGTAGDLLKKAQTYAIQATNGTLNNNDMAAIGEQIDKMIDELVDIANTTMGGKYIFAGTDNNRPPFKRVNDTITYQGNLERVYREILDQANYAIDVPSVGDSSDPGLFGFYDNATNIVSGGIFDTLIDFKNRLKNGDVASLEQSINEIDDQVDHLLSFRVQVGARTNHFESVQDQLQDQELRLTQVMSNLEDVDLARVSIDLAQQQLTYQSSLAAGAQILQVTLLDFLK